MHSIIGFRMPIPSSPSIALWRVNDKFQSVRLPNLNLNTVLGWTSASFEFALSPDSKYLAVASQFATDSALVNLALFKRNGDQYDYVDDIGQTNFRYIAPFWSHDSTMLVVGIRNTSGAHLNPGLKVFRMNTSDDTVADVLSPSFNITSQIVSTAFNADCTKLVVTATSVNTAYVMTIDNTTVMTFTGSVSVTAPKRLTSDGLDEFVYSWVSNTQLERINTTTASGSRIGIATLPSSYSAATITDLVVTKDQFIAMLSTTSPAGASPILTTHAIWDRNALASPPFLLTVPLNTISGAGYAHPFGSLTGNQVVTANRVPGRRLYPLGKDTNGLGDQVASIEAPIVIDDWASNDVLITSPYYMSASRAAPGAELTLYNAGLENLLSFPGKTLKLMLVDNNYVFRVGDQTMTEALAGTTEISGFNWPVGGPVLTGVQMESPVDGYVRIKANSTGANLAGGSITARHAILYDAGLDVPIAHLDFGADITAEAGERLSVEFDDSGIVAFVPN